MKISELVKHNEVFFDSYRQGVMYYRLCVFLGRDELGYREEAWFLFTVPLDDVGTATLKYKDKAITFMRWIRKAVENKTLIELK